MFLAAIGTRGTICIHGTDALAEAAGEREEQEKCEQMFHIVDSTGNVTSRQRFRWVMRVGCCRDGVSTAWEIWCFAICVSSLPRKRRPLPFMRMLPPISRTMFVVPESAKVIPNRRYRQAAISSNRSAIAKQIRKGARLSNKGRFPNCRTSQACPIVLERRTLLPLRRSKFGWLRAAAGSYRRSRQRRPPVPASIGVVPGSGR